MPESRIVMTPGNENYSYVSGNAQSPAVAMPPVNIVLFDDPYDEITDPTGCSGTLAMGGAALGVESEGRQRRDVTTPRSGST